MTKKNVIAKYVYTADEYTAEFPNMRNGDIFMGAFNAEQVMYNHFGYRTPIANLYLAGSSGHPGGAISGGAGYITAGIIARDLGAKLWWKPWDAGQALSALSEAAYGAARSKRDNVCHYFIEVVPCLGYISCKSSRPRRTPSGGRPEGGGEGGARRVTTRSRAA